MKGIVTSYFAVICKKTFRGTKNTQQDKKIILKILGFNKKAIR